jgi:3-dehydroquinate dehydratase II
MGTRRLNPLSCLDDIGPSVSLGESDLKPMRVLLIHGPNLNRLGSRDPSIYGIITLDEIVQAMTDRGRETATEILHFQSNHEGRLIDWLQIEAPHADAIVINPGGLAHYSVALRDALDDAHLPVVEVHISNPTAREAFRHTLVTATAATKVVTGKGLPGYLEALDFIIGSMRR